MKLFTASFSFEANTFSTIPTGLEAFEQSGLIRGGVPKAETARPQAIFRDLAAQRGWDVVESLCASAEPAAPIVRPVYEALRDEILSDLRAAMPVDVIMLDLHGAMVADGYDDCEGDLLTRMRQIVGPKVPIGVELDLHFHLSQAMLDHATVLVAYKEYPHTDMAARAHDVFRLTADALEGRTRPVMEAFDCRMIGIFHTTSEPMAGLVREATAHEGRDGVLSVSLCHGMDEADVPDMGAKVLVVADGDRAKAADLAERLGRKFYAMRQDIVPTYMSVAQALDAAADTSGPTVIADVSDNPGAGHPGDGTLVLREVLQRDLSDVAMAPLWDPVAVSFASQAGIGAEVTLRLGGKTNALAGMPVDVVGTVTTICGDLTQSFRQGDDVAVDSLGAAAVVTTASNVDIVLVSKRGQTLGTDLFSNAGINPLERRILLVKSQHHFYDAFAAIAGRVIHCHPLCEGSSADVYRNFPFQRIRRPMWPFDADPLGPS